MLTFDSRRSIDSLYSGLKIALSDVISSVISDKVILLRLALSYQLKRRKYSWVILYRISFPDRFSTPLSDVLSSTICDIEIRGSPINDGISSYPIR